MSASYKKYMKQTRMGRNVYGERCIKKVAVIQKENAFNQYIDVLIDVEKHRKMGVTLEYDVFYAPGQFTKEDINDLNNQVAAFLRRM